MSPMFPSKQFQRWCADNANVQPGLDISIISTPTLELDRPGVRQVPEGSGEQGKMEKTGCKIVCGAPTTLAVKGLIMMMMLMMMNADIPRQLSLSHPSLSRSSSTSSLHASRLQAIDDVFIY